MRLELYRYSSQKDSTLGILFLVDDETVNGPSAELA